MATGDLRRPTRRQRRRIEAAVHAAEQTTGIQLCVFLGAAGDRDLHARAEEVFVQQGLTARPAVLVLVDPPHRHVDVVTGEQVRARIPDHEARSAVDVMVERFAAGDLVGGVVAGVERLAAVAGPGTAPADSLDLPDLLG